MLLVSHDRDFLDRIVTSTIALEGDGTATEYAGGYSDYLQQRKAAAPPEDKDKEKTRSRPVQSKTGQAPKSSRLSFKHKHRLKTLPDEMAEAEKRIKTLEAVLADPTLYDRDPAGFEKAGKTLADAHARLAALEEEWLELEILREDAEG